MQKGKLSVSQIRGLLLPAIVKSISSRFESSKDNQGSTNDVHRVRTYTYFYWHTHDFEHAYIDKYARFFPIFNFQNLVCYSFILFTNLLL